MNEQLKALVFKLDREIWALVEKGEATVSWARQESAKLIQLYSDQKNKEMWEKHDKQIADWKREEKMWGEHELHYKAEIQRLTKEVEELKEEIVKRNWGMIEAAALKLELTRLRELLGKAKNYIFLGYVGAVELSDEISNALNHKP